MMRQRGSAPGQSQLVLMCQIIMLLFFVLAAAICVRVFLFSSAGAKANASLDLAVVQVESVAEICKASGGDLTVVQGHTGGQLKEDRLIISYTADWTASDTEASYTISVQPLSAGQALIGQAEITAAAADGSALFAIIVAWQEDAQDE